MTKKSCPNNRNNAINANVGKKSIKMLLINIKIKFCNYWIHRIWFLMLNLTPPPQEVLSHSRRRRRRWKVCFGEATNYSSRQKNLQYLSRKIITIVMVHKPQTDIYIPALTRKIKNNTSVTQRYHFDFILQKGLGVAMTKTHEINSNLRQSWNDKHRNQLSEKTERADAEVIPGCLKQGTTRI